MSKCFFCDVEIQPEEPKRFVPLENPYVNLPFHKACYRQLSGLGETNWLITNSDRIFKYAADSLVKPKEKKKVFKKK
jgi:hypothetical protein